jgi:hypothetical protein
MGELVASFVGEPDREGLIRRPGPGTSPRRRWSDAARTRHRTSLISRGHGVDRTSQLLHELAADLIGLNRHPSTSMRSDDPLGNRDAQPAS